MARPFSISIFVICLLEFVFWMYCTSSPAGAAEQMYMTSYVEAAKQSDSAVEESLSKSSELDGDDQQSPLGAAVFSTSFAGAAQAWFHLLVGVEPPLLGRLGVWLAIGFGLLGFLNLFPHFSKRVVEFFHLLRFRFLYRVPGFPKDMAEEDIYCYRKLVEVSRSFAAVIAELPEELRRPIANFYLVLRGLDTIEDDMAIELEKKTVELRNFYKHLREQGWNVHGYGDNKVEQDLLENFHHVAAVFLDLKPAYQQVIEDITKRMGDGMAKYAAEKKVVTTDDYDEYCHYVAGLVGIGLSKMFAASGLESEKFSQIDKLSNSMGLFLQKTNVTRDYLEDVTAVHPRIFYPNDIWGKYAKDIKDLTKPENKEAALQCLNEMVTNAMVHIPDCLDYLALLRHPNVFKFCGIPQAMAIATLARIYNNYAVFQKEVKIRKGEAVQIMMYGVDYDSTIGYFKLYIDELERKIPTNDPNAQKLQKYINIARQKIAGGKQRQQ